MMIEAKNEEQQLAIKAGIDFIDNGNPEEFFVIVGKAGTGKTTIAEAILKDYINKQKILVCALSHKAKLVISEKLIAAYGTASITAKSVAGALGMNMDMETGKFTFLNAAIVDPPIKTASIILVDEGSMINEESHELIMKEKRSKAKVIYLGDIRQLPPIRENNSLYVYNPSPVFYSKNVAVLNERIRQGEESPILPFADFFGDNSRRKFPLWNPVPPDQRKSIITDKGALVFSNNREDVIETVLPLYKYAVEHKDMNVIKIVSYRNEVRKKINHSIRFYLFGNISLSEQYVVGDLLMFSDNYQLGDIEEPLSNSLEIQVNSVQPIMDGNYKVWSLGFVYESKPVSILVLDHSEIKKHAADVSQKFDRAKKLPFGSVERSEALSDAWRLKQRYAPIEYAYAITSHKSQGSTYNTVVVDELDIMAVKLTSNKAKSQAMYTAITRASVTCIVIDGQMIDESLQKAVELSHKKLTEK